MARPRAGQPEEPGAAVEIGAAARARRLCFRRVPETEVRFEDEAGQDSGSHTDRENLPDEVEPGITYRDVGVRWRAGARLIIDEGDLGRPQKRG